MLSPSESEIPAAFPKSRCPPSITPPSTWVTPVSKQFRAPANQQDQSPSLEITGQLGHYRLQGTNPHEAQSYLQAILQTENHQMQYRQFQQMYGNSMFGLWSNLDQQTMNAYERVFSATCRCSALSIERWCSALSIECCHFRIGRSDTITPTLWKFDGSGRTRSALR